MKHWIENRSRLLLYLTLLLACFLPLQGNATCWPDADGDGFGSGFSNIGNQTTARNTNAIALGDVDADGDLDLIEANFSFWEELFLFSGGTSGNLSATPDSWRPDGSAVSAAALALGDLDGDGNLDLVVGYNNSADKIFLNTGTTFSNTATSWSPASGNTYGIALGDVDGDNDLDIAIAQDPGSVDVYLNSSGSFSNTPDWSAGNSDPANDETDDESRSVDWGDWDNDGDLDLAVGNENGVNRIYDNIGTSMGNTVGLSYTAGWSSPSIEVEDTYSIAWGDWDGDGDLDLAFGNNDTDNSKTKNRVYENSYTQNNSVALSAAFTSAWVSDETDLTRGIAWGDMDGDGDLDLAAANNGQPNRIYQNNGNGLNTTAFWSSPEVLNSTGVSWGDVNNDGKMDLVFGSTSSHKWTFHKNTLDTGCGANTATNFNDCDDTLGTGTTVFPRINGVNGWSDGTGCYRDDDSDGFGNTTPPTNGDVGSDCNDSDDKIKPRTNGVDGWLDTNTAGACMKDSDNDHYGDTTAPTNGTAGTDCIDTNDKIFPRTTNLNGWLDTNTAGACMKDSDNDHYGDTTAPSGGVAGSDCDDSTNTVHPNHSEACDGVDNDCDGTTADGTGESWFNDPCDGGDADDCNEGNRGCTSGAPSCSDTTGDTLELCDGIDNDCKSSTLDGADEAWLGNACDGSDTDFCNEGSLICSNGAQSCDDTTNDTAEICDGNDNDCDGQTDEGFTDSDSDGIADCIDTSSPTNNNGTTGSTNCGDSDGDGCNDCANGSADPNNDGLDSDSDGLCDIGDTDDDGDSLPDTLEASLNTDPLTPNNDSSDLCAANNCNGFGSSFVTGLPLQVNQSRLINLISIAQTNQQQSLVVTPDAIQSVISADSCQCELIAFPAKNATITDGTSCTAAQVTPTETGTFNLIGSLTCQGETPLTLLQAITVPATAGCTLIR